jgi:hypothetical protein
MNKWDAARDNTAERKRKRREKRKQLYGGDPVGVPISELKRKLWKDISEYVQARDKRNGNGNCMICGWRPITLAYHIIPAQTGAVAKWDYESNIVGGCLPCNTGEHYHRLKYYKKHLELFGEETINALEKKYAQNVHPRRGDFIFMLADVAAKKNLLDTKKTNCSNLTAMQDIEGYEK